MDNRFGVKDFFLFGLLLAVLVSVWLAMKQFDLQKEHILVLERRVTEITQDLNQGAGGGGGAASRGPTTTEGVTVVETTVPAVAAIDPKNDPFYMVRQARAMPNYAEGDWLVINLGTKLSKITPLISSDVYGSTVQARVMEPLLVRDPATLDWQPLLAESYSVSPDGKSVTYKLRHGVRFSDGSPFTSADVKFTYDLIMDKDLDAARARSYLVDNGLTYETPDEYTVVFHLDKPYFDLLNITGAQGICSKKLYGQFTARQINDNPGLLIGTGPYRLDDPNKWRPGTLLVLYRNERYWGVPPAFTRIVYLEDQEETVYATKLRNGDLDYTGVTPEQYKKFAKDAGIKARCIGLEYQSVSAGYTYIAWNQEKNGTKTRFADRRVRQAMTMLVDRERMANELYYGYATVATGPFASHGPQSDPSVKPWPYDIARAKALLKEAGYEDRDGSGVLQAADGTPFKVEFMYPAVSAFGERIALFLKDQLAKGGIVVELKGTDWPTMLERLKKSQFDMTSLGWSASVEGDPYQIFDSSQRGDAGDNRTNYSNPELDALIEKGRAEVDTAKRMEIWHAVHRILAEDQPYTFLLERKSLAYYDKRIENVKQTRMGINFMPMEPRVPPWFVPKGQQLHTAD
jgi:peptide/nickel transport system substrate-binding protein